MQSEFITDRLILKPLALTDCDFMMELTNSPGWLKFIGDRGTKTQADAKEYIIRISNNTAIYYWVVRLKNDQTPIGVITFIKRDYLENFDIGFAFLPDHTGKDYAYEATKHVLTHALSNPLYQCIDATTLKNNIRSIRLLERLGLTFKKEFLHNGEDLLLYSITKTL